MAKYFLATIGFLLFGLILALPLTASAAWNDVQYTAAANLYLPDLGATLVVSSGSNVASITVNPSSVAIAGAYVNATDKSSITLTSSQRLMLSNDWGLSTSCGSSSSTLTVTWSAATSGTSITITPTGSCPVEGGGGGVAAPVQVVTPTAPTTTTGEVTTTVSAGGKTTLTTTEGTKATVELPANAVTADTVVKAASVATATVSAAAPAPTGKTLASAFDLTATAAGLAVTSFAKNVTITLTYTDSQISGLDETTLKVYRWTGTEWQVLSNIVVNAATNTITGTTTAFSYFAIIGEPPAVVPEVPVVTPPAKPISEMTITELKAEIARIAALISQLQAELAKLIAAPQAFTTDLYYGLKANSEVKRLQEFLISKGYLGAGLNTGNYLSLTVAAVKAYQTAKGITPVAGYFGPKTRAAVNSDLGLSQ